MAELNAAVCFSQQHSAAEMKGSVIWSKTRLCFKKKGNYEARDLYLREMVLQLKKPLQF